MPENRSQKRRLPQKLWGARSRVRVPIGTKKIFLSLFSSNLAIMIDFHVNVPILCLVEPIHCNCERIYLIVCLFYFHFRKYNEEKELYLKKKSLAVPV